ncbi:YiiX/YebB-like N1pC/P60 family cysteine hydrolase [Priestia megaterium]|uniref:hypothetical protein n=1 Tax=Priestia megaterium TaxID=1404 RepID=UPI002E1DEE2B|nr:YiiX/YebB-like N1pC/P60 family cysteine hydrolase [Priestia megaterium]
MKKGDIVFVRGKGWLSKVIRYFDSGEFSHCAIAVSKYRIIEANYNTRVSVSIFDESKYDLIEVIDLGLSDKQRDIVYERAMKYLGKKYDYFQLIWYALKKVFHFKGRNLLNNPNDMICSELVFIALDESGILRDLGINDTVTNGSDLTPNELYDLVKYVSYKKAS